MKKSILSFILVFIVIANLFAPISVGLEREKIQININTLSAEDKGYHYLLYVKGAGNGYPVNFTTMEECNTVRNNFINSEEFKNGFKSDGSGVFTSAPSPCVEDAPKQIVEEMPDSALPECMVWTGVSLSGCIAQGFYYILFVPTSYLFALAGTFFDNTFAYSVSDQAYKSTFVVEGWGIVRDMCNMFFIFILIYIAFSTILGTHGFDTKGMIIKVVIIGLLINFSLFASQVIIDTSNILARVFYNSNAIQITYEDSASSLVNDPNKSGVINLSAAIVSKVNPQSIIINAKKANIQIPDKAGQSNDDSSKNEVSTGTFILITILATATNIVGLIVFLMVGLIFVARVIGLWFSMILVPIAFFTYTVPAMQDIEMVGWKKWWPETLKLAFLAPVFIFFMYLILAFLEKGLGVFEADGKTGMDFLIATLIPFAFIMILMWKAKDIAKDMSGKIGQTITNGIAAAGGIALGVATGGAALAMRGAGRGIAKMSRGETSTQKYEAAGGDKTKLKELGWGTRTKGWVGSKLTGGRLGEIQTGIGGFVNKKQKDVGKIDHARHIEDATKKSAGLVNKDTGEVLDNSELTGTDLTALKNEYNKTKKSEVESEIRKGFNAKGEPLTMEDKSGAIYEGENDYKSKNRNRVVADMKDKTKADHDPRDFDKSGKLSTTGQKKLEDRLNMELNTVVKANVETKLTTDFNTMRKEAATNVNPGARAIANVSRNSYDLRKLADMKSDKREGFLSKVPVALISGIAMGVRAGMKGVGVNSGGSKITGNFMKDLSNTISESLKVMKVNVDLHGVGEHKSSANAHGGDTHGGGGHH